ncbi:MAG: hypothetical protein ACREL3_03965 [Gemmatimonadales bacterium]
MPFEYPGQLYIPSDHIERPQHVAIPLSGINGGANIMCVYTGTAVGTLQGKSQAEWNRSKVRVTIPTGARKWTRRADRGSGWTQLMDSAAVASPASVFNKDQAICAGWAVDAAWVYTAFQDGEFGNDPEYLVLDGLLAVRDTDGYLYRIAYQITVLGREM